MLWRVTWRSSPTLLPSRRTAMSAHYPSTAFAELLMSLGRQPQERTRNELFDALGLDDEGFFLTRLADADRILRACGVEVRPRLQDEPPDGTFLLRQKNAGVASEADLRARLSQPESASQEFKSTYWYDLDRSVHQPGRRRKNSNRTPSSTQR